MCFRAGECVGWALEGGLELQDDKPSHRTQALVLAPTSSSCCASLCAIPLGVQPQDGRNCLEKPSAHF